MVGALQTPSDVVNESRVPCSVSYEFRANVQNVLQTTETWCDVAVTAVTGLELLFRQYDLCCTCLL